MYDKAVFLYHKGGDVNSALELCFRSGQYEMLRTIGAMRSVCPGLT